MHGPEAGDQKGVSLALSGDGDIVAAGATRESGCGPAGTVHVMSYNIEDDEWSQLGKILAGPVVGDRFGQSVALSADGFVVAVGAPWE